jgi:hypothetical protein
MNDPPFPPRRPFGELDVAETGPAPPAESDAAQAVPHAGPEASPADGDPE